MKEIWSVRHLQFILRHRDSVKTSFSPLALSAWHLSLFSSPFSWWKDNFFVVFQFSRSNLDKEWVANCAIGVNMVVVCRSWKVSANSPQNIYAALQLPLRCKSLCKSISKKLTFFLLCVFVCVVHPPAHSDSQTLGSLWFQMVWMASLMCSTDASL